MSKKLGYLTALLGLSLLTSARADADAAEPVAASGAATATSSAAARRVTAPPSFDPRVMELAAAPRADRIEADIRTLVGFGTRHTMSETASDTQGIGAAVRWMKAEFEKISAECGGCLEVYEQRTLVKAGSERIDRDTEVVNVYAVLRGTVRPNDYVIMSGDIDSRVTDVMNSTSVSPGANDNASGLAGTIEAARVLSRYKFANSIVLAGLSGEEQNLYGGEFLAAKAKAEGWNVIGVLNNDMIGNIEGVNGVVNNRSFRIFSEPYFQGADEKTLQQRRYYGGEVDGPSRQLARYVYRTTQTYLPQLDPMMVYRLDRFGRGGHHTPFNNAGFPAVRLMETNENYNRQHQDIRTENGVQYGDVIEGVNFDYAARLTGANVAALASLGWAPAAPTDVALGGGVQPAAKLRWKPGSSRNLLGHKIYYRLTTEPQWTHSVWVPAGTNEYTMTGLVVDNYYFGVAAVSRDGNESLVQFPSSVFRD